MTIQNEKTILVTGGSSGIGEKTVEILQRDGFRVIIFDLNKPKNQSVEYIPVDLSKEDSILKAVSELKTITSELDGIVNCAGIYPSIHLSDYTLELMKACLSVNVIAPYLIVKELLPLMEKKGGNIVNVTSGAVYLSSRDPGYSVSKSAISGLTKSLAKNLASKKIMVNSVAPGPIDTPMSRKGMRSKDVEQYVQNIPLHRFGNPSEVAEVIAFLLSGKGSYMTGSTIHVNGGLYLN